MKRIIAVSEDLYNRASELANRDHVSVEEYVGAVLAGRLSSREHFKTRNRLFTREFERAISEFPGLEHAGYHTLNF
jgi:hypothetical protein